MVPFPTTYGPLSLDWMAPKTPIAIISGTGKFTDFKFGRYIHSVLPNKSPLNILEKRERGRIQKLPKFFGYPLLGTGAKVKFCMHIRRMFRLSEQKSIENVRQSSRGRSQ